MFRILSFLIFAFLGTSVALAEPFWGSKASQAPTTAPQKLKPGQFIWKNTLLPIGPMMAVIKLSEQKVYVYRNSILMGISTISSGRGSRRTPTGVFSVLNKTRFHRSKKYNNAPMPYTQWLTSKGIAMHAGKLPGYPASHGCIRMPSQFARFLFETAPVGMRVVITHH